MATVNKNLQKVLSKNLIRLRRQKGLSQEDLALRAGIDRTYVSGCEREIRNPTIKVLEKLASALEIDAHKLLQKNYEP